eukprot:Rhum_TRINITY_DN14542_c41_g1::Rhum_TRINITY_DN14542_c41_g1_i1::g.97668::m.97668
MPGASCAFCNSCLSGWVFFLRVAVIFFRFVNSRSLSLRRIPSWTSSTLSPSAFFFSTSFNWRSISFRFSITFSFVLRNCRSFSFTSTDMVAERSFFVTACDIFSTTRRLLPIGTAAVAAAAACDAAAAAAPSAASPAAAVAAGALPASSSRGGLMRTVTTLSLKSFLSYRSAFTASARSANTSSARSFLPAVLCATTVPIVSNCRSSSTGGRSRLSTSTSVGSEGALQHATTGVRPPNHSSRDRFATPAATPSSAYVTVAKCMSPPVPRRLWKRTELPEPQPTRASSSRVHTSSMVSRGSDTATKCRSSTSASELASESASASAAAAVSSAAKPPSKKPSSAFVTPVSGADAATFAFTSAKSSSSLESPSILSIASAWR